MAGVTRRAALIPLLTFNAILDSTLGRAKSVAMTKLTISARGRVTLHKDVLEHLGVRPGDPVIVDKLPGGRIEIRSAKVAGRISDVFDIFKKEDGPHLSIDEINKIARPTSRRKN